MYIADTSNSGTDGMFPMMKPVPGGGMPGVSVSLYFDIQKEMFSLSQCP